MIFLFQIVLLLHMPPCDPLGRGGLWSFMLISALSIADGILPSSVAVMLVRTRLHGPDHRDISPTWSSQ